MHSFQLTVYIQPGAHKTEIVGKHGEHIKIRLQAPATDGKANKALIQFLADTLATSTQAIQIIRGEKSRIKTLVITATNLPFTTDKELESWLLTER